MQQIDDLVYYDSNSNDDNDDDDDDDNDNDEEDEDDTSHDAIQIEEVIEEANDDANIYREPINNDFLPLFG